jgi:hypothetical protein
VFHNTGNKVTEWSKNVGKAQKMNNLQNNLSLTDCPPTDSTVLDKLDFSELDSFTLDEIFLAIDWDPTALHLRYQSSLERAFIEHSSVGECRKAHIAPVQLSHCLNSFTSEERLEEPYNCTTCRGQQPATKKLQIWKLPPIMVMNLFCLLTHSSIFVTELYKNT